MNSFVRVGVLIMIVAACHKDNVAVSRRSFKMGFAASAPRYDFNSIVRSLNIWSTRADAAIISMEVPWDSLLNGEDPGTYVVNNCVGLAEYYRKKNFSIWVYIDPENGLNRAEDAAALVKRGKSIADPDMQNLYVRFVISMDSLLQPAHLGLALETNLIRGIASHEIYQGIKSASKAAAVAVRKFDRTVPISISVQVDYAWGKITNEPFIGIDQDLTDFDFINELGLSSYPYFNFKTPEEIPDNYYSRIGEGKNLPLMVTEGGWTSARIPRASGDSINGSPLLQKQYIQRQFILLNNAKATAWFQLAFTDIDIAALPADISPNIRYFAFIGLIDTQFQPKPALASWDSIYERSFY